MIRNILKASVRKLTGTITHVLTEEPVASLTFDDGPDPVYTPKVLDILKRYNAQATFFMVGEGADNYPDIVKLVARDGHAIGNHSWNHLTFPLIPLIERWNQIKKCQRAIAPYGQRLFRPPYGITTTKLGVEVLLQGYEVIGWSLNSDDWCEENAEAIVDNLVNNIKAGSIILLHDRLFDKGKPKKGPQNTQQAVVGREPMLFALREVLERINDKIEFVSLPELLRRGRPQRGK